MTVYFTDWRLGTKLTAWWVGSVPRVGEYVWLRPDCRYKVIRVEWRSQAEVTCIVALDEVKKVEKCDGDEQK